MNLMVISVAPAQLNRHVMTASFHWFQLAESRNWTGKNRRRRKLPTILPLKIWTKSESGSECGSESGATIITQVHASHPSPLGSIRTILHSSFPHLFSPFEFDWFIRSFSQENPISNGGWLHTRVGTHRRTYTHTHTGVGRYARKKVATINTPNPTLPRSSSHSLFTEILLCSARRIGSSRNSLASSAPIPAGSTMFCHRFFFRLLSAELIHWLQHMIDGRINLLTNCCYTASNS